MPGSDPVPALRLATSQWLGRAVAVHGDVLRRPLLEASFEYGGRTIHLLGPQGIRKPGPLDLPLSITTVAGGPYADARDFTAGANTGRGAQRGPPIAARPLPRLGDRGPRNEAPLDRLEDAGGWSSSKLSLLSRCHSGMRRPRSGE